MLLEQHLAFESMKNQWINYPDGINALNWIEPIDQIHKALNCTRCNFSDGMLNTDGIEGRNDHLLVYWRNRTNQWFKAPDSIQFKRWNGISKCLIHLWEELMIETGNNWELYCESSTFGWMGPINQRTSLIASINRRIIKESSGAGGGAIYRSPHSWRRFN